MVVVLSNGVEHEIKVIRDFGKFRAYIEVLGFHDYGRTEEEAIQNFLRHCKPYIREVK